MYQDNMSAILLEKNGHKIAGKRSRHLNIRYFFIMDMKEQGQLKIEYCPTDKILGDYHTKPLHGTKMNNRSQILNLVPRTTATQLIMLACVRVNEN
jgi:hypothetical protein